MDNVFCRVVTVTRSDMPYKYTVHLDCKHSFVHVGARSAIRKTAKCNECTDILRSIQAKHPIQKGNLDE